MWQFGVEMNIEQAKAKLNRISKSTATKHPKVLVSELCVIVKFLLDEVDRINTPTSTMSKHLLEDATGSISSPYKPSPPPSLPLSPSRSRPVNLPHPYRKGNAGDAK